VLDHLTGLLSDMGGDDVNNDVADTPDAYNAAGNMNININAGAIIEDPHVRIEKMWHKHDDGSDGLKSDF
jgi:hypothetical protein